nr:hypothetical protein B0A51_17838 [Rachicladosporium sp. CCFEE 5018]
MSWLKSLHIRPKGSPPTPSNQQPSPSVPPRPSTKPPPQNDDNNDTYPDNTTLLQTFEWHTPSQPPPTNSTHSLTSHYALLSRLLPSLPSLGITTIWLPPGCKSNTVGSNGYDCYDIWDLGEFDQKYSRATKWGSREELADLIRKAGELGVEVMWDAVLNHKTAGDRVEECWAVEVEDHDRRLEKGEPRRMECWVRYDFPGRNGKYSQKSWGSEDFSGTDWDQRTEKNGIFKIIDDPATYPKPPARQSSSGISRFARGKPPPPPVRPGRNWAQDVDDLHGNYDFLMFSNIRYTSPPVREDTFAWGEWMLRSTGVQGFRLDAVQHISYDFIRDWVAHVQACSRALRGKEALIVGEIWTNEVHRITKWLKTVGQGVKCFDSPLLYNFSRISQDVTSGSKNADLRTIKRDSLLAIRPEAAITVVGNHDTQAGQASYTPMATELKILWYAFTLLRAESSPCVFWGDLYGTQGPLVESPACLDAKGRTLLPSLMLARKLYAYGPQIEYFTDAAVVGWTRAGGKGREGCAVVLSIGKKGIEHCVRMQIGMKGETWVDLLGAGRKVVLDEEGCGEFGVLGRGAAVYVTELAGGRERFPVEWDLDLYGGR